MCHTEIRTTYVSLFSQLQLHILLVFSASQNIDRAIEPLWQVDLTSSHSKEYFQENQDKTEEEREYEAQ